MVGECHNDLRCCDYPVSRSVCSGGLDEPVIRQRAVLTYYRFMYRLYVDYVMILTRRDLNLEPRVYGFHIWTGFRM